MNSWLAQNKEWLLSGAGVTVITSLIAILSSVITYWIKSINDKKFSKELALSVELKKYKIESNRTSQDLAVAYKGHHYDNLCEYSINIKNIGMVAIEKQKVVIKFPADCIFVDQFKSKSSQLIKEKLEVLSDSIFIEHSCVLDRLESSDQVIFTYLIDTEKFYDLNCQLRGVDGVNYVRQGVESVSDTHKLIYLFALFTASGAVPFLGAIMQAGVLIFATPTIVNFVQTWRYYPQLNPNPSTIIIRDVTIEEGSNISVNNNVAG